MLEFDILEKHNKASLTAKGAIETKTYITRRAKNAAATKIQAVFRSYLVTIQTLGLFLFTFQPRFTHA